MAVLGPGSLTAYWRFQRGVAKAQLTAWLPAKRRLLIDISGPSVNTSAQAAAQGHTVVRVIFGTHAEGARTALSRTPAGGNARPAPHAGRHDGHPRAGLPGRVTPVVAEPGSLAFLADGCADGVIAEDGALSRQLMAEDLAAEIARVLRPGGELLACVDSLVLGMAILAEQHHWAQLTDVPHAEVVLVPWPDGTITRCYGPDQARELFTGAGLRVNWMRSRTVFSESMVTHWLRRDPGGLAKLVRAELAARSDESLGAQLVISASKPRPRQA